MKKTAIALAVAVATFATAAHAAPKDNTWYTGAKIGWSNYHDANFYPDQGGNKATNKDRLGAGAFLGYQANQYLGFELGYDWLGRVKYDSPNTGYKSQGIQLTAKVGYPITDSLDIYTRLGGIVWRADVKEGFGNTVKAHDTGVSPVMAAGIEYAITQNISTRLDYQWISNIGEGTTVRARPDNSMLSLGIAYRFGQGSAAPVAAVAAAAAAAAIAEQGKASISSDNMFPFAVRTMNDSGREIVDAVFDEIADRKDDVQITIVGHADRIGSPKANKTLSTNRAKSVANYFTSKGVPAANINTRGAGQEEPVTGSTCDSVSVRAELIECLAADRRVDIEIK